MDSILTSVKKLLGIAESYFMTVDKNLGQTVSYETYQLDVERAENSPGARNDILAKRFNLPMEGVNGKEHPATDDTYLLPLPESEESAGID